MDKELEKYYENQFDMMSKPGWIDFMATVEALIQKDTDIMSIKDETDLFKRQGRLDILNWLKNWKSTCEVTLKSIEDEENL